MNMLNCASVLALIASGVASVTPAIASPLTLSPTSITVSHEMSKTMSLDGEDLATPSCSQQQQQQHQKFNTDNDGAGMVYAAPESGFTL